MEEITNKKQNTDLFMQGHFGNTIPFWKNLKDLKAANLPLSKEIVIRSYKPGFKTQYNVPISQIDKVMSGLDKDNIYFNDSSIEDSLILIQGELTRNYRGLDMLYSTKPGKMKESLEKETLYCHGLKAKIILKHYLDPSSYDTIMDLLDKYEGHAIEFSCWRKKWGSIKSRNTIIWEVRNY